MSSYKKHILFSLLMVIPFFPDVYYLSLAVIGASMVDLDNSFRYRNLFIMAFSGGILAFILLFLNLTPFPGILLISIAFFSLAQHRDLSIQFRDMFDIILSGNFRFKFPKHFNPF